MAFFFSSEKIEYLSKKIRKWKKVIYLYINYENQIKNVIKIWLYKK